MRCFGLDKCCYDIEKWWVSLDLLHGLLSWIFTLVMVNFTVVFITCDIYFSSQALCEDNRMTMSCKIINLVYFSSLVARSLRERVHSNRCTLTSIQIQIIITIIKELELHVQTLYSLSHETFCAIDGIIKHPKCICFRVSDN